MSVTESYLMSGEPEEPPSGRNTWESLLIDYKGQPNEYRAVLEKVPFWGQEFLLRLRDYHPESYDHSLRVAATVDGVLDGRSIGDIPADAVTLAALLHDIKKEVVPKSILDKDGPLTGEERGRVKPHAIEVYPTIKPHDLVVAQMAGGHHLYQQEPYGHEGAKRVPWDVAAGQQIIAGSDAADALGSVRSYKPAWPEERVRATLLSDGILSPVLINRVVDVRFSMPPLADTYRNIGPSPREKIVFQAGA